MSISTRQAEAASFLKARFPDSQRYTNSVGNALVQVTNFHQMCVVPWHRGFRQDRDGTGTAFIVEIHAGNTQVFSALAETSEELDEKVTAGLENLRASLTEALAQVAAGNEGFAS